MARSKTTPSSRSNKAKGSGLPAVEVAVKPVLAKPVVVAKARLEAVVPPAAGLAAAPPVKAPAAPKPPVVPKKVPPKARAAAAKEAAVREPVVARETAVAPAPREAPIAARETAERPAKPAPARAQTPPAAPAPARQTYSLQVAQGFSLLTQQLEGGEVVVSPPVPPGASLRVSWWKEARQLSRADVQLTSVRLHTLLDGAGHATRELGKLDAAGRLVRAGATVELPVGAKRLEYWFELTTVDGETLWDSNLSRNYALELG